MMILCISGSPKTGPTEDLLDLALRVATERGYRTERILCSATRIAPCIDCGECARGQTCPIDDDMPQVSRLLSRADGVIVGSPAYFGSVSSQLKALFDRTLPLKLQGGQLKDKAGCAFSVPGPLQGGHGRTVDSIQAWMLIQGMIVVGGENPSGMSMVQPSTDDVPGIEAVEAVAGRLCDLLDRTGKKGSCWAGGD
ncbi:MAG: flavodoxin family protein [Methanosarcinales archaeon]|nr:flavodoxin family protein [Methanosarcinales archaeon]